jgi:hypothetical protein
MKAFNSFQMVTGFALTPFGIAWVSEQTFRGSSIAFWVGCVVYLISFLMMVGAVYSALDE